jgi:hypothetical protein
MPTTADEIHAGIRQGFAKIAQSPTEETKFPVGQRNGC